MAGIDDLPDGLAPYKGRLSARFYEERKKVVDFCNEVTRPRGRDYAIARAKLVREARNNGKMSQEAPQPPMLKEVNGLTVLEYSPIAEILGQNPLANIAMNCSAPDTGNMEVLEKFGNPEQKKQWLEPLLNQDIRSAFAMTEPGVASSDASQICTKIESDGNDYVINGHKWYISGAMRPECKIFILLGKTRFDGPDHQQQSMILVPKDTPGINILRGMGVFGHIGDHAEIIFENVRVPASNMVPG